MIRNTQMLTTLALTGMIWFSCQKNDELIDRQVHQTDLTKDQILTPDGTLEGTILASITNCTVTPVIFVGDNQGGNVECSEVGDYEFSSGRINYNCDDDDNCAFDGDWPEGFIITTDGITVNWSYEDPNGYWCLDGIAVIVKGGPNANVYTYESGCSGGEGLTSPINSSNGKPYGLSNLTLCFNLIPCDGEVCYKDETAWAAGTRYVTRGNWATWTAYDGTAQDLTLFAGQTHNAGTVSFSDENNGEVTITITLNPGFILDPDTDEAVKIQGYEDAPSGNPSPGRFTTYKGNETTITVEAFAFYGIHLDVLREVECED